MGSPAFRKLVVPPLAMSARLAQWPGPREARESLSIIVIFWSRLDSQRLPSNGAYANHGPPLSEGGRNPLRQTLLRSRELVNLKETLNPHSQLDVVPKSASGKLLPINALGFCNPFRAQSPFSDPRAGQPESSATPGRCPYATRSFKTNGIAYPAKFSSRPTL